MEAENWSCSRTSGHQLPGRMAAARQTPVCVRSGVSAVTALGPGSGVWEGRQEEEGSRLESCAEMEPRPWPMASD